MKQLGVKSLRSDRYRKFREFCRERVAVVVGVEGSVGGVGDMGEVVKGLGEKCSVRMVVGEMGVESRVELSVRSLGSYLPSS
jgi:hypothetical protein